METIAKVRRKRLVEHESISQIARDLRLARNTVKRILKGDGSTPVYKRQLNSKPRLGPFLPTLHQWVEHESRLPKRERRTAQRLFEDLRATGYGGGVTQVQRYVQQFYRNAARAREVFIPQSFAPGEALQFDWSQESVVLDGQKQIVHLAHVRLCFSRFFLVIAYPRETQEMLLDAHRRAFAFFGGVPRRGIYDNMKTAVDAIFTGKERRFNARFLAMCNHYLMEPVACTPASGWEKGQVENQVGNVREWLFTPRPQFTDLAELNAWLAARCLALAQQRKHPEQPERSIWDLYQADRAALMPCTVHFEGFFERPMRVSSTALVNVDNNRYSVDCRFVGQTVLVRSYADRIVVVSMAGQIVADHPRQFTRHSVLYNPWHYVSALSRKPGALRNGAPFKDWNLPNALTRTRERLVKRIGGDREFVDILSAVASDGLERVSSACAEALQSGSVSSAQVLAILARDPNRSAGEPQVPEQLTLVHEPMANCARYDRLLVLPTPKELH